MGLKKAFKKAGRAIKGVVAGAAGPGGIVTELFSERQRKQREQSLKAKIGEAGAAAAQAVPEALRGELEAEETGLEALPGRIRTGVTEEAKKAGTFAETPEFRTGAESESLARIRGARFEAVNRIRALRRRLGLPEEGPALA